MPLKDETIILFGVSGDVSKKDIKMIVGELFKAECLASINPDAKVQDLLAQELLVYLLALPLPPTLPSVSLRK